MTTKIAQNDKIIDLILNLSRFVKSDMSFDKGSNHLTLHQLQTLIFIAKGKEVRMADIAQNFRITKPTSTSMVDNLVGQGFLKREVSLTDRREVIVSLGKKGQKFLDQAMEHRTKKIAHILSYISEKDKQDLTRIIEVIVNKLKEENE